MSTSWIRYSVAVYLGLLISGALGHPPRYAPSDEPLLSPSVYHDAAPPTLREPETSVEKDALS